MKKNTRHPFGVKLRPIVLLAAGLLLGGLVQAQESTNTSGGNATGNGGTVAYSVGQVGYTTNTSNAGSVTQGVQQSYIISNVGINETALTISFTAFPNPTTNTITLQMSDYSNEKLSYQLYDMQSKLLSNGKIVAQQTEINMTSLSSATYFINIVNQENKKVQSFKIIKQ